VGSAAGGLTDREARDLATFCQANGNKILEVNGLESYQNLWMCRALFAKLGYSTFLEKVQNQRFYTDSSNPVPPKFILEPTSVL
jgi:hypothetical protein